MSGYDIHPLIIDQLTQKFDIKKYNGTYPDNLMKLIKAKAKGVKMKEPTLKVVHSKSKDIMSQLCESLNTSTTRHRKAS